MPRQARIKSETGIYHIMTKGITLSKQKLLNAKYKWSSVNVELKKQKESLKQKENLA